MRAMAITSMIANFRRRTITRIMAVDGTRLAAAAGGTVTVKFSPQQFLIISCLLAARAPVSREELADLLYGHDPGGGPENTWHIRVQIHLMRHGDRRGGYRYGSRLDPLGIEIVSVFSHNNSGYLAVVHGRCLEHRRFGSY
jgi:hypothetical protein